jgi:hypothetical protein
MFFTCNYGNQVAFYTYNTKPKVSPHYVVNHSSLRSDHLPILRRSQSSAFMQHAFFVARAKLTLRESWLVITLCRISTHVFFLRSVQPSVSRDETVRGLGRTPNCLPVIWLVTVCAIQCCRRWLSFELVTLHPCEDWWIIASEAWIRWTSFAARKHTSLLVTTSAFNKYITFKIN